MKKSFDTNCLVIGVLALLAPMASSQAAVHTAPGTPVSFLTDLEGSWSRFTDFLNGNPYVNASSGQLAVAPGAYFVYNGDIMGVGPANLKIYDTIAALRTASADQVISIIGNREIGTLEIPFVTTQGDPETDSNLASMGLPVTPTNRMMDFLNSWGGDHTFGDYTNEVSALRGGAAVTPDEVRDEILASLKIDGRMGRYLKDSVLIARVGQTLFVHGAITAENFGRVPDRPGMRFKDVDPWINDLNRWYRGQIDQYFKTGSAPDLLNYGRPVPGTWLNQASVIMARPKDFATNQPALPPAWIRERLKSAGIYRIVVGHTPNGDSPTILRGDGFEVIIADNSGRDHGTRLDLIDDQAHVVSKALNRDEQHEPIDMTWKINDQSPLGKRLGDGYLVKAYTVSPAGKITWVGYSVGPRFADLHRFYTPQKVAKLGTETPRAGCGELFGMF